MEKSTSNEKLQETKNSVKANEDIFNKYKDKVNQEGKNSKKRFKIFIITIIATITFIIAIAIIAQVISNIKENHEKAVQAEIERQNKRIVPNVVGMTRKEAIEELEKNELEHVVSPYTIVADDAVVTSQSPEAGKEVMKNDSVTIYVKRLTTIESDNFYGMRFKKTIVDFCEDYNKALENIFNQLGENTKGIELSQLEPSDFTYYRTISETGLKQYNAKKFTYQIFLFTESNSDYIVDAGIGFDGNSSIIRSAKELEEGIIEKEYPAMVMALTDIPYIDAENITFDFMQKDNYKMFKDNISYSYTANKNKISIRYFYITAVSEDKYNDIFGK